ncbi:hypothetical protein G7Y89_g730 [Cudoniella acicularis]|uniref:DUF7582 domain-containing protein n=1 Tax=Cudoniella acicularis TaxID=354080 RepID=A0A8H4W8L7_9HELO|nr:hypothetical protein G7Y89_g730 [Cudoniella acicularis]
MPITKDRISSPLEAGSSLLDAKQLPAALTAALEYVSSKLARKHLHLSLVVIRKEVQMPAVLSPQSPFGSVASVSPARSSFSQSLSKSSSSSSISSCSSSISSSSSLSRTQYPSLPSSPKDFTAIPRLNIPSSSPSPALPCSTPTQPNGYGISLLHSSALTPKAEKILRHTIAKAEKKFSIGSGWISPKPLTSSARCPATTDLIKRSLLQNEVIFSSEGLTLLSLDHVYTFKNLLNTYSRTLSPFDLTLAVDELRRLVLAQQGRKISKSQLMRAYDWLPVSLAALVDINEGYKIAYDRKGSIEVQDVENTRSLLPALQRLQTNFTRASPSIYSQRTESTCTSFYGSETSWFSEDEDTPLGDVSVGESARGTDSGVSFSFDIAETVSEDRGPHFRGPLTPKAFEDITPITKGEWCFLMVGEGFAARTAAVETC